MPNNDYISYPDSADWFLDDSDFTILCAINADELPADGSSYAIWAQRDSATSNNNIGLFLVNTSGTYSLKASWSYDGSTEQTLSVNISISADTWYDTAVMRKNSKLYIFFAGNKAAEINIGTNSLYNSTAELKVGASDSTATNFFVGNLDEFTWDNGVARFPLPTTTTTATLLICDFIGTVTAETGTIETSVTLADHGLNVDDFIVNASHARASRRILSTTTDTFTVTAVSGQTVSDFIRTYKFTDHTDKLQEATLNITKRIEEDTEANFTMICPPTYIPRAGQYVKLVTNGNHVFTGLLKSVKRRLPDNGIDTKIFCDVECATLNLLPARRTIQVRYDFGTTASTIVQSMVNDYLVGEGVTSGTISQGVELTDDWYDDCLSISDVFDTLADQSGYQWFIDKNFNLQFYKDPTTVATYSQTITDGSTFTDFRNVSIEETIENYENKAFYIGNTDDWGNIIIVFKENEDTIIETQNYAAGSGVWGVVERDSGLTGHEFFTAETGTFENAIVITGIESKVTAGDMVYNIDLDYRVPVLSVTTDTLVVFDVPGQTVSQNIVVYEQINDIIDNHLNRQSEVPRIIEFDSFTTDFEPGQKLEVKLSNLSISTTESYVIENVDITDRGAGYFVTRVKASKRNSTNFSTQRTPNYIDYFRKF